MVSMMPTRDILAVKQKAKKKTRRAVFDLVTSTELVPQLKKAIKVLKSIGVNLKRLEKDYKPISSVYKLFLDLPSEMQSVGLTAAELKSVKAVVKVRFDCVYDDAHGLSYLLDRYMGEGMDMATRTGVEAFLESWYGDNRADDVILELTGYQKFLVEFKRKSKRRWQLLCDNKLPVYDFWCGLPQFPLLQGVAMQLFRCAASSSASERNFSTHGYIHLKLRNRLAPERVETRAYFLQREEYQH
ncbi:hypothetical protein PC121_g12912 [Phytophthora cactorum]|nr:hypothetical protein PC120_g18640 [Phytophthora cactorum]KAG3061653.1 hypothetical protein PC121_g12912 [Phytophthora cactorum]